MATHVITAGRRHPPSAALEWEGGAAQHHAPFTGVPDVDFPEHFTRQPQRPHAHPEGGKILGARQGNPAFAQYTHLLDIPQTIKECGAGACPKPGVQRFTRQPGTCSNWGKTTGHQITQ